MALLEEMSDFIATGTGLSVGADIFAVEMPPKPAACIGLFEYDGTGPEDTFGTVEAYEDLRLQVQCRGADYVEARSLADSVHAVLRGVTDEDIGGRHYHRIRGVGTWMTLEIDTNAWVKLKRDYHIVVDTT